MSLPDSDVFEASDIEFYVKGYLESRRSEDFRSPVRTDWTRLAYLAEHGGLGLVNGHTGVGKSAR